MSSIHVTLPLAEGVEEMEAVTVADTLRRGGLEVCLAGLAPGPVRASRGVVLMPDGLLDEAPEDGEVLIIPGGAGGVRRLREHPPLIERVRRAHEQGRPLGALCAGPLVLLDAGVLGGKQMTSYPSLSGAFPGAEWIDQPVVEDGKLITGQGPGAAIRFALVWLKRLTDEATASEVERGLWGKEMSKKT